MTIYNKLKKINKNFQILNLYRLFYFNEFIIFFNYKQVTNKQLYNLKNEFFKLQIQSKVLIKQYRNKIFDYNFNFLNGFIVCVFINSYNKFLQIYNLLILNKINFIYSFKRIFSNFILHNLGGNVFITIHYIIYKIIYNIIILLLYFIINFIKYLI